MSIEIRPFDENVDNHKPIAVYGATACAEISIKVIRNKYKKDVSVVVDKMCRQDSFCGIQVVSIEEIDDIRNYNVLICAAGNFWNIAEVLQDVYGVKEVFHAMPLLDKMDENSADSIFDIKGKYENAIKKNKELVIHNLSIVITEKCSLRCKYCTEFVPFLKNPVSEYPLTRMKNNVDRILDVVKELDSLTILGGEAFVNPNWEDILNAFLHEDRIKKVSILTNGTIIPKKIGDMQDTKFVLEIDDYGDCGKSAKVKEWADSNGINNIVFTHRHWFDVSDCSYVDETERDLCNKYQLCQMKNCWSIVDKYLFRCPTAYYRLKHMVNYDIDTCDDFINLESMSTDQIEHGIRKLINASYIQACHYCRGNNENNMIDVAEQVSR